MKIIGWLKWHFKTNRPGYFLAIPPLFFLGLGYLLDSITCIIISTGWIPFWLAFSWIVLEIKDSYERYIRCIGNKEDKE